MFCQYNAFTSCLLFVTLLSWEERIVLFTKVDRDWFLTSIILLHQWSFWHLHCLGHPGGGCLYLLLTPGIGTKWEGYEISIWDLWILFTFLLLSYWIPLLCLQCLLFPWVLGPNGPNEDRFRLNVTFTVPTIYLGGGGRSNLREML